MILITTLTLLPIMVTPPTFPMMVKCNYLTPDIQGSLYPHQTKPGIPIQLQDYMPVDKMLIKHLKNILEFSLPTVSQIVEGDSVVPFR